jgi:diaminopimelate epimerase
MKIAFTKYQGTGNDFVILDNRENLYSSLTTKQVRFLCDRRFGIGADGLMLLNNKPGYDFEMIYYNADGNEGSMCGNGGRCLVQFAHDNGIAKTKYYFSAVDGDHHAEIEAMGIVRLKMKDVKWTEIYLTHSILNTGSPHYVKPSVDINSINIVEAGRAIRYSPEFAKEGINVNFVEIDDPDSIYMRTYERGVEGETLSCGTGVTASALIFAHNDNGFNRVKVRTPGGHLIVEFEKISDHHFEDIWLCGPAAFVFKGEIDLS